AVVVRRAVAVRATSDGTLTPHREVAELGVRPRLSRAVRITGAGRARPLGDARAVHALLPDLAGGAAVVAPGNHAGARRGVAERRRGLDALAARGARTRRLARAGPGVA